MPPRAQRAPAPGRALRDGRCLQNLRSLATNSSRVALPVATSASHSVAVEAALDRDHLVARVWPSTPAIMGAAAPVPPTDESLTVRQAASAACLAQGPAVGRLRARREAAPAPRRLSGSAPACVKDERRAADAVRLGAADLLVGALEPAARRPEGRGASAPCWPAGAHLLEVGPHPLLQVDVEELAQPQTDGWGPAGARRGSP